MAASMQCQDKRIASVCHYWVPSNTDNLNGNRGYGVFHHNEAPLKRYGYWDHPISSRLLNEFRV